MVTYREAPVLDIMEKAMAKCRAAPVLDVMERAMATCKDVTDMIDCELDNLLISESSDSQEVKPSSCGRVFKVPQDIQ